MIRGRYVLTTAVGALTTAVIVANMPWFSGRSPKFDLTELRKARLVKLDGSSKEEASKFSGLKSDLDKHGVPLYGIVHENVGVQEFKQYLKGDIYLDEQRIFYGPHERWMGLLGLLKFSVLRSYVQAISEGFSGNIEGEGRLLGGSVVVGPGDQGILFEYHSMEFGDHADPSDILQAVGKIQHNK